MAGSYWYYGKNGEQQGPVSSAQLRQLAQSGELQSNALIFKDGGKDWVPASSISGLFPAGGVGTASATPGRGDSAPGRLDLGGSGGSEDVVRGPSGRSGKWLIEFLMFRRMIAPVIIMILFWLGVLGVIAYGLFTAGVGVLVGSQERGAAGAGCLIALLALVGIPFFLLVVRLYAELCILAFRMNETLTDIKELLERQRRDQS